MNLSAAATAFAVLLVISGCNDKPAQEILSRAMHSGDSPIRSQEIVLEPAMNPIRITVSAKVNEANRASHPNQRVEYQLSLFRNGKPQKQWAAMLSAQGEDGKARSEASFTVEQVEVAEAGTYVLVVHRLRSDTAPLFTDHYLRVWRNYCAREGTGASCGK